MEKIVGIICFIFFGLGFIVALIKFIFKKQRDKQTVKVLVGGIIMLAMSIYLIDASLDVCIDVHAILKGTVAFLIEGAVFECDMVHIAEWLLAADVATYELDVLAVPGKILAI